MIYNFNKNQKIIIAICIGIILTVFLYYNFFKSRDMDISIAENTMESSENNNSDTEEEKVTDKIVVHISGAVNKEGVVELEENSRICDAIDRAEGLKENADTTNINLAYKLEDGMKIYIPTIEEKNSENNINQNTNMTDESSKYVKSSSGVVKEDIAEQTNKKININKATQTEFESLPGIGPATASKIIDYRTQNGKFKSIEDIKEVSGIGNAKFENIKDLICTE